MRYSKYFDFEMLEKHAYEYTHQVSDTILLGIIVIVVYYLVKLFLDWDN